MNITKKISVDYYNTDTGESIDSSIMEHELEEVSVRFKTGGTYGNGSRYSKVFQVEDPMFEKASYYQYFYRCLIHLEMVTNRIVKWTKPEDDNIPLDKHMLSKLFNTSIRTVNAFLEYCRNNDIIVGWYKDNTLIGYVINPMYALNGNKIGIHLYMMFKSKDFNKHIPKSDLKRLREVLKIRDLGSKLH